MTGRTVRARAGVAVVAVSVLVAGASAALSGCGISSTGPVRAGGPATGVPQRPGGIRSVELYFASPYGIRQASRPSNGTTTPQQALNLLLEGPTEGERARGLSNHVPLFPRQPSAFATDGGVDLYVPLSISTGELDNTALSQLVCTLAHAKTRKDIPPDRVVVSVYENSPVGPLTKDPGFPVRCGPQYVVVPAFGASPPSGREAPG
ncbi:hypothetical protein ACIQWR_23950 [Streptomyces sp. NPDC098789]|uniref:hypothetical protein n=1 Tax=Streptomyces sp. NPDC098789 TaxID=3366098 RepID=UPI0037FA27AD